MKTKILGVLVIGLLLSTVAFSAIPAELVAWWQFEDNANDATGNNHGNEVGTINYVSGKYGKAVDFDGTAGNYIEVLDSPTLDIAEDITIEAWVKISDIGSGQRNILRKGHFGDRTYGLDTVVTSDGRVLRGWVNVGTTGGAAAKVVTGTTNLATNDWIHVAMTYDKEYVRIFVNGVEEGTPASSTADIYQNNLSVRIGGQPTTDNGGPLAFKGLIDEVRIWNKALSEEELADNDLDGYGYFADCNDENPDVNPGAEEACNGIDDNCDDAVDNQVCEWSCETEADPWKIYGKYIGTAGYLGVNRFMWTDAYSWGGYFTTLSSKTVKGKTNFFAAQSEFTLAMTNGCSCTQILDILQEYNPLLYGNMEGHRKFGCSKGIIEEFLYYLKPLPW
ncbi:MAG: LamG-like jellyroll fold domain-containing protein [Candidatus Diapherotrites archaeon]